MNKLLAAMSALSMLTACTTTKKAEVATPDVATPAADFSIKTGGKPVQALPHVYIYKTKADYSDLVPVTMNPERTRIMSYPAKSDIRPSAKPVPLVDGWYLDLRGIGPTTAFTDYTYDEYSRLEHTPSASELMQHIIDKSPLLELRDCGTRRLTTDQLNDLISSGLQGCPNLLPSIR